MSTVEILTDDVREEIHTDDLREENETPNDPGNELRRVSKILNNTSESYRSIVRRVRAATFLRDWLNKCALQALRKVLVLRHRE